ncbi:MAG: hypothetical protein EHM65_05380 [Acidobacteriales bacterium]|nr:MAG: hypothetical protein EHM65_05380 [Terriglobales bacterium]
MPGYQQISWTATGLQTDAATLLDFSSRGWIQTVEKNGSVFIAADQRYRAKYILHLRRKKNLSDEQIDCVLSVQRPPYSAADVDQILREHGLIKKEQPTGRPGAA